MHVRRTRFLVAFATLLATRAPGAQGIAGRVTDTSDSLAIIGATVSVFDTAGVLNGIARTDDAGRFAVRVPLPGLYGLYIQRPGYVPFTSDWLRAIGAEYVIFDIVLTRLPRTLSPVVVEAKRPSRRERKIGGVSLRSIDGDIITPEEVQAFARDAADVLDLIRSKRLGWVRISNLCPVSMRTNRCLTVIIDEVLSVSPDDPPDEYEAVLHSVRPEEIEWMFVSPSAGPVAIATLRGGDMSKVGTRSGGGTLYIYTRRFRSLRD